LWFQIKEEQKMATKTELNLRPLGERVIVRALPQEERTKSGIYLPDTAKEKPQQGEVVAVGKGKVTDDGKTIPMNVKAGDKVLYGKYSGTEVKLDGEEFLIIKESEILAILP
jgi:chaperonin GroES